MMRTSRGWTFGSIASSLVLGALGCASSPRSEAPPPPVGPPAASVPPDELACEGGDNESCVRAAEALKVANAREGQQARQFHLWKLACERGQEASCLDLAAAYGDGRGVKRDPAMAIAIKRASCERGHGPGCESWGLALLLGQGQPRDVPAAAGVCFDGPAKIRASWCHLLGSSIDEGMAEGDLPMLARLYAHACSAESGPGCSSYGAILFRQGKRLEGLELLRTKCEHGLEDTCGTLKDLLALVAMEERHGGGPLGTPPAPLHLRLPEHGLSYDPPDENWGTSVPTHPGPLRLTMWRWWRRGGRQIEVSVFDRLPRGRAAIVATMPELMAASMADGVPITKDVGVLGGKPCSHAFFAMGATGRGDLFLLASDDALYSLLVLQQGVFSEELLERARAGFRFEAK